MSYTPLSRPLSPPRAHVARCGWFWAWVTVGIATMLGLISLGFLMLIPAGLVGALLWRKEAARRSAWGLLTGTGLPLLLVALLNRAGPGFTCYRTATAAGCSQHLDPIPWLVAGLALTFGGLVAQRRY